MDLEKLILLTKSIKVMTHIANPQSKRASVEICLKRTLV